MYRLIVAYHIFQQYSIVTCVVRESTNSGHEKRCLYLSISDLNGA